jgi:hypothetical protein
MTRLSDTRSPLVTNESGAVPVRGGAGGTSHGVPRVTLHLVTPNGRATRCGYPAHTFALFTPLMRFGTDRVCSECCRKARRDPQEVRDTVNDLIAHLMRRSTLAADSGDESTNNPSPQGDSA